MSDNQGKVWLSEIDLFCNKHYIHLEENKKRGNAVMISMEGIGMNTNAEIKEAIQNLLNVLKDDWALSILNELTIATLARLDRRSSS